MSIFTLIKKRLPAVSRYHYKWVIIITLSWTLIDLFYWIYYMKQGVTRGDDPLYFIFNRQAVILRLIILLIMSSVMGYLLIFKLRDAFRDLPLLLNQVLKICVLLFSSFFMNFLVHVTYSYYILDNTVWGSLQHFYRDCTLSGWLLQHSAGWLLLFILTLLLIEINEKYSPGVFFDILIGRYINPRKEKRIVMFIDLKDSTPIAEQLDSTHYFRLIRDFIYHVSMALLEYDGRIYQYVGDEIVVSWRYSRTNMFKCLKALIAARNRLARYGRYFKRVYGVAPGFKTGIHAGEVTIGEIGLIKKDLAMSGDTMNTTARIRTACTDYNEEVIISADFLNGHHIPWAIERLGNVDLKGKSADLELFALKLS